MTAFKAALNAHQLELSFDLGGWYVKQCTASGGSGLVDLKAFAPAVDRAIIENYADSFPQRSHLVQRARRVARGVTA